MRNNFVQIKRKNTLKSNFQFNLQSDVCPAFMDVGKYLEIYDNASYFLNNFTHAELKKTIKRSAL